MAVNPDQSHAQRDHRVVYNGDGDEVIIKKLENKVVTAARYADYAIEYTKDIELWANETETKLLLLTRK